MITSWLTFNTTAGTAPAGPSASTARPARPSTARSYRKRPGSARDHRLPVREGSSLTGARCLELFDAQLASRHLDLAARWLRGQGKGFYTIASAGHEGNA